MAGRPLRRARLAAAGRRESRGGRSRSRRKSKWPWNDPTPYYWQQARSEYRRRHVASNAMLRSIGHTPLLADDHAPSEWSLRQIAHALAANDRYQALYQPYTREEWLEEHYRQNPGSRPR